MNTRIGDFYFTGEKEVSRANHIAKILKLDTVMLKDIYTTVIMFFGEDDATFEDFKSDISKSIARSVKKNKAYYENKSSMFLETIVALLTEFVNLYMNEKMFSEYNEVQ